MGSIILSRPLILMVGWLVLSCASGQRSEREKFRELFGQGKYQSSLEYFQKELENKDQKSLVLQYLELGRVQLSLGLNELASFNFQKGLELYQEYYTQSISQKVATTISNDNYQNYRGESYEISMAFYYQALSNLLLYSNDTSSNRRQFLFRARAAIVGWDSYLQTLGRNRGYDSFYQQDLWGKIIGALIHQLIDSREDGQISLQLYKDALQLLKTQGMSYLLFNNKAEIFSKNISKANFTPYSNMNNDLEVSNESKRLTEFLNKKIIYLTKKYRPSDLKQTFKDLNVKETDYAVALAPGGNVDVLVIVEEGLISRKIAKKFDIGFKGAIEGSDDPDIKSKISASVLPVLAAFAAEKLGLVSNDPSFGNFVFGYEVAKFAVSEAAISFEMPMIELTMPQFTFKAELKSNDKSKKILQTFDLPLMTSMGEIARQEVESKTFANWFKTGARVAGKHALAILGAFTTYKAIAPKEDSANTFFARAAAVASYLAASKGIEASERADIRYWTTLPNSITADIISVAPGEYDLSIMKSDMSTNNWSEYKHQPIKVTQDMVVLFL